MEGGENVGVRDLRMAVAGDDRLVRVGLECERCMSVGVLMSLEAFAQVFCCGSMDVWYVTTLLSLLGVHDICSHRELDAAYNVRSRVQKIPVLEYQDAAGFGHNVKIVLHIHRMERCGTSFELRVLVGFV